MEQEQQLFNLRVNDISLPELMKIFSHSIATHQKVHVVTLNPEMVVRQAVDQQFRQALTQADFRIADGAGLMIAANFFGKTLHHRIPGIELVMELIRVGQEEGWSFYFLGSSQEVMNKLIKSLREKFPRMIISGFHHGYFQDSSPIVEEINRLQPNVLLVGLGSPRQELWINHFRSFIETSIMVGVGGSFDVLSGSKRRAPVFFRKIGFEWLYRIISEPRRLKRVVPAFLKFGWMTLKEKMALNKH